MILPRLAPLILATGAALALVSPAVNRPPALVWNTTRSAPVGVYRVSPIGRTAVGDLVAVRPCRALAAWLDQRGYLPAGALLIKRVAAVAPSRVCRAGAWVVVDNAPAAVAAMTDRRRRALPQWRGCRALQPSELFLLNAAPGSLDSRYFGPLPRSAVVGRLEPLLLAGSPADAG
jgi:conjugative transfer signal peptidase TraF